MVWNQQFTHSLNVWCKQVQGLLRQAHTTSCNRARPVECVVWVIRKCSINLSATWFSDNICVSWKYFIVFTMFYCMFYYMFRKPLISFRIHPLFRVFKRWASWPRWLKLNVWCFWRRGCFLVVAEVKRSIETCRLKQSWVFNQREDHWTNLLTCWSIGGMFASGPGGFVDMNSGLNIIAYDLFAGRLKLKCRISWLNLTTCATQI